ncbi:MAG TPA: dihydrofolate reductase family protein [Actinomycetota bacterium]|nr:dihydrofolate reductase family protein [Actinomycetota bacterium]
MSKLVVGTFVSVDGVMQGPGGPEEDRDGGFELGGWTVPYWDEMMMNLIGEQTLSGERLLLGRRTYEIFAGHWPQVEDDPVADKLNNMPKFVASNTLKEATWKNTTLLQGDVAGEIARLKDQDAGDIHVTGSSNLIQTLLKHDLVDEFVLWVFPVVLGNGKRLFGGGAMPAGLELADSKVSTSGVTINTYRRAGAVQVGSFALDQ